MELSILIRRCQKHRNSNERQASVAVPFETRRESPSDVRQIGPQSRPESRSEAQHFFRARGEREKEKKSSNRHHVVCRIRENYGIFHYAVSFRTRDPRASQDETAPISEITVVSGCKTSRARSAHKKNHRA